MNRLSYVSLGCVVLGLAQPAGAYRPFDGTDADVAAPGAMEFEVGPAEYRQSESQATWFVPAVIFNYGFARDFEFVLEGRHQLGHSPSSSQITDSALSVKEVLREGELQGHSGISIANEWSCLFPNTGAEQKWGAELTTIFSSRWRPLTLNLNVYNELSRQRRYVTAIGPIIEGPFTWSVRPVVELIATREFGAARWSRGLSGSALVGAIGRVRDDLTVDLALLVAKSQGLREQTLRAGFTWSFDTGIAL